MVAQKTDARRLRVEEQKALAKAVSLFSKPGDEGAGRAGAGFVIFAGKIARFSNGLTGLEIPFTGIEGCALPLGSAAEVVFRGETEIDIVQSEDAIKVTAGGFTANLRFVNQESFPAWPTPVKSELKMAQLPEGAWEKISSVAFAADVGARSEISGVLLHKTMAFASDGLRAARVRLPGVGAGDLVGLLPLKLVALVDGYATLAKPNLVAFGVDRAWVRFEDGSRMWALLPAADYPMSILSTIAERSKAAGQTVHAAWGETGDALGREVERVVVFSDGLGVTIRASGSTLEIHGKGSHGEARAKVAVTPGATLPEISVGGSLLADAVRRAPGVTASAERDGLFFRGPGFELLVMCLV
jgi:hypothetical protein